MFFFFFKQKTAYEMRISDWSSDVCSSNVPFAVGRRDPSCALCRGRKDTGARCHLSVRSTAKLCAHPAPDDGDQPSRDERTSGGRSEEHTSELQSLMRISYAVFCLQKKNTQTITNNK